MKQSTATANDLISEQWFLAETEKQLAQKKVVLDEIDLGPFEPFVGETYGESPAAISGDSADDLLTEILMGLNFRPEGEDPYEEDEDDDSSSRSWTDMDFGPDIM